MPNNPHILGGGQKLKKTDSKKTEFGILKFRLFDNRPKLPLRTFTSTTRSTVLRDPRRVS